MIWKTLTSLPPSVGASMLTGPSGEGTDAAAVTGGGEYNTRSVRSRRPLR